MRIARGDSETWRQGRESFEVQSCFEINRLRILVGEETLLGAVIMGDQTLSEPLRQLINQQADITAIRPNLFERDASLANTLIDFWKNWSTIHV